MNNFLAPSKTSYKLCGYISDDSQYGFKTPVFKHEDECFIQNAEGDPFNERIESFIKIDPNEERAIAPIDKKEEFQSQIGSAPLFVFCAGSNSSYIAEKNDMQASLKTLIESNENFDPFVYLDVLYFIDASELEIKQALNTCANQLKLEGATYWKSWQVSQVSDVVVR